MPAVGYMTDKWLRNRYQLSTLFSDTQYTISKDEGTNVPAMANIIEPTVLYALLPRT
jgi:hypothetical protein